MKRVYLLVMIFICSFVLASCEFKINIGDSDVSNYETYEVIVGETIDLEFTKKDDEEIIINNEELIDFDEDNSKVTGVKPGIAIIEVKKDDKVKSSYEITIRSGKYDNKITNEEILNDISVIEVGEAKVVQTSTIAPITSSNNDVVKVIDNNVIYGLKEGSAIINYGSINQEVRVVSSNRSGDIEQNLIDVSNKAFPSIVTVFNYTKGTNYDYALYAFGSGIIYKIDDDNIYILTNRHVVMGSEVLQVYLKGSGEKVKARLVAYDDMVDLAIVVVKRSDVTNIDDLKECKFGLSSEAKVGQFVITIGSPLDFELEGAVCFGIISKKDVYLEEDIDGDGKYEYFNKYLQVDASINSGNSGGPLFDMNGHVIGINTAKMDSSIADNLGFSIPTDIIFCVLDRLENASKIKYKSLGISVYTINQLTDYDIKYDIPDIDYGTIVTGVNEDSLAYSSGILEGDVITSINGIKVLTSKYLLTEFLYSNLREDEVVTLEIYRDESFITIEINLNSDVDEEVE